MGRPIVATLATASLDYLTRDNAFPIDPKGESEIVDGGFPASHRWAKVTAEMVRESLQNLQKTPSREQEATALRARQQVEARYSLAAVRKLLLQKLENVIVDHRSRATNRDPTSSDKGQAAILSEDDCLDESEQPRLQKILQSLVTALWDPQLLDRLLHVATKLGKRQALEYFETLRPLLFPQSKAKAVEEVLRSFPLSSCLSSSPFAASLRDTTDTAAPPLLFSGRREENLDWPMKQRGKDKPHFFDASERQGRFRKEFRIETGEDVQDEVEGFELVDDSYEIGAEKERRNNVDEFFDVVIVENDDL